MVEYLYRKIEDEVKEWLDRKEFIIIKGPRQSGKTTFLLHLKETLENSEYITFQDFNVAKSFSSNPKLFIESFLDRGVKYLLIDEAQMVKDVGEKLKLIYDLYSDKIKIILTGSGNFDIKNNISGYLVGRSLIFNLFPLSFEEFIIWKRKELYKAFREYKKSLFEFIEGGSELESPIFEEDFFDLLKEFLAYGSFPAIVKEENKDKKRFLLSNLVLTYLEKDVLYFFGIRNLEKFKDLLTYLANSISNIFNPTEASSDIKISYQTLQNYLEILQQSFIIFLIKPFAKNLSTEIKKARKLYFIDLGIRNYLIGNLSEDLDKRGDSGKLLENFIFLELIKNFEDWKINYWRTTNKAEIDFIISKDERIIPIEVKFSDKKLGRGFYSFLKVYKPEVAIVFTLGKFGIEKAYNTKIAYVPHYYI